MTDMNTQIMNMNNNKKPFHKATRVIAFICCATLMISLAAACGKKNNGHKAGNSLTTILKEMGEGVTTQDSTLPDDLEIDTSDEDDAELNFSSICDVDYDRVAGYYHAYSLNNEETSEIAIICAESEDDVSAIVDALNAHIADRRGYMENYAPELIEIIDQSIVYVEGCYIGMFIGEKTGLNKNNFIAELEKHGLQ